MSSVHFLSKNKKPFKTAAYTYHKEIQRGGKSSLARYPANVHNGNT